MPVGSHSALRVIAVLASAVLFVAGSVLAYMASVALRRGEGVFLPAGYVAAIFLVGAALAWRAAMRW